MKKRRPWFPAELEYMRELYPNHTAKFIANVLGRSIRSVHNMAHVLGLKKSPYFFESDASGRRQKGQQDPRIKATQFKKGQVPWNKGIEGSAGLHPNSRATQFKKGRTAQESSNYLPIGSLRLTKDGWLERKVTDDHPVPARRWVAEHRLVWERANGPIPPGHIVVFKPGQKTAIENQVTADKLECITRAENAKRNSLHRFGPEMSRLYQLKGAITRQLNRITKEAKQNV